MSKENINTKKTSIEFKVFAFSIFPLSYGLIHPIIASGRTTILDILSLAFFWVLSYVGIIFLAEFFQKKKNINR